MARQPKPYLTKMQTVFTRNLAEGMTPTGAAKEAGFAAGGAGMDALLSNRAVVNEALRRMRVAVVRWNELKEGAKRLLQVALTEDDIDMKDRLRACDIILRTLKKGNDGALLADSADAEDAQETRLAQARKLIGSIPSKDQ